MTFFGGVVNGNYPSKRTLTEGGREFKAAKQSTDFLNVFNKVMTASVSIAASLFEALFQAFV